MAVKRQPGQLGLFRPDSNWEPPTGLPDLRGRPLLAMDLECKDSGLAGGRGPGWAYGRTDRGGTGGYICGVAWAAEGSQGYAPIRHPDTECLDEDLVMRWVDDHLKSGTRIVFHNAPYDCGWLGTYGLPAPVAMEDTQPAAVMLDETQRLFGLDACCARAGVPGKDTNLLRQAVEAYGGDPRKPAADLWRLPARYGGPYAEADGLATLALWQQYEGQMKAQGVWDAYRTEIELIPMVVAMRRRGIRLNVDRVIGTAKEFRRRRDRALEYISRESHVGRAVTIDDVRSPRFLEKLFAEHSVPFPRTQKTKQGSFSKDWMERHEHWLPRYVTEVIKYEDAASKFCEGFLLDFAERGRLHAEVHQFLGEEGGTRSHRFSYSSPPLQQMPSPDKDPKDKETGKVIFDKAVGTLVRRCFLPEKDELWAALDYSSQEPRITVHFAAKVGARGADEAVRKYIENPRLDYHQMVADMISKPRPRAKIMNLAMTYGKGKHSIAEELGLSLEETEAFILDYHTRLPYIKALEDECKRKASSRGYIRLIDGARMHYPEWEGGWVDWEVRQAATAAGKRLEPCGLEEARRRQEDPEHPWHRTKLRRADTRKALNNLVQGSAARQTKRAMLAMWREGILPLIQMHDEVGISAASPDIVDRAERLMIETTPLLVPIVVDAEIGPTWGEAKMTWEQAVNYKEAA